MPDQLRTDDLDPRAHLGALEAILMVAEEPIPEGELAAALGVSGPQILDLLEELQDDYEGANGSRPRGFRLYQRGGGWRIYSAPEHRAVVSQVVLRGQTSRLTQAALETLAVIAYRGPVTRGQVAAVRGVNVDSVVRTLTARGLVMEAGTEDSGAIRYEVTARFWEKMGLNGVEDLPPLAPYLPDGDISNEMKDW
ncbi:MAG: SMC-Scp complex subunit ScpB [Bowdeniella nasicola]|nr:SMC-Scp complex subunit ScpB [Bowdeniella nasicola]